jgi:prepilin-type N-terminal cleavage/methylation domain-containing protein
MHARDSHGFSLIEMLVTLTILLFVSAALAGLFLGNARLNNSQSITAEVQANARNTLSILVQTLRSAGWNPDLAVLAPVILDSDPTDGVEQIEIFADFDADGLTATDGERILIRYIGDRVEWRRTELGSFVPLAVNIGNDADGDGIKELMFTPFPNPNPTRIRVQVTAESRMPDPATGQLIRYTVNSDVVLRNAL